MNIDSHSRDPSSAVMAADQSAALDGNAAAGAFAAGMGVDVTVANVTCALCGDTSPFAQKRAYIDGPGVTLRCRHCAQVLARVATTPYGTWLSLVGSACWHWTGST